MIPIHSRRSSLISEISDVSRDAFLFIAHYFIQQPKKTR